MKSITCLLVMLIGMISLTSVASPIDKGEKATSVECSKEYSVIENINKELKNATIETVKSTGSGCTYRRQSISGDIMIKCTQNSDGTFTKEYFMYDSSGGLVSYTSMHGLIVCGCN